jgi:hypothetical protein
MKLVFKVPDSPKAGHNIHREHGKKKELEMLSKLFGNNSRWEYENFNLNIVEKRRNALEIEGKLNISKIFNEDFHRIHLSNIFYFENIEQRITLSEFIDMATQVFNFLTDYFIEYSQYEQNKDMPKISIHNKILENYIASEQFINLYSSL